MALRKNWYRFGLVATWRLFAFAYTVCSMLKNEEQRDSDGGSIIVLSNCVMAQSPDFCLYLTDGDAAHMPTTDQTRSDFDNADNYGITEQGLANIDRSMIVEKNHPEQPHKGVLKA